MNLTHLNFKLITQQLYGVFFLFLIIVTWGLDVALESSLIFSTFAVILIFFYFFTILLHNKRDFSITLILILALIPVILSNLYIENGNFITEEGIYGFNNGATIRLSFYIFIYFIFLYLFLNIFNKITVSHSILKPRIIFKFQLFTYSYMIGVLLLSIMTFVIYGSPMLSGMSRFHYWINLPSAFSRIPILLGFSFFFLGILIALNGFKKRFIIITFILLAVILLFAEKFTMIYLSAVFFSMSYFTIKLYHYNFFPSIKKLIIVSFILLLILLVIAGFGYIFLHGYSIDDVVDKIISRAFGLQGHVWFGVDRQVILGEQIATPSDIFKKHTEENPSGIVMLMWAIAPHSLVEAMREYKIRFTMGSPAIAVATIGYIGAIFYQVMAAFISAIILSYLYHATIKLQAFRILVSLLGLKVIIMNVFLMGESHQLFRTLGILIMLIILIDIFIMKYISKYKFRGI
jgi:hypothetical protein